MPTIDQTDLYTWKAGGTTGTDADYVIRLSKRYSTEIATILGLTVVPPGGTATGTPMTTNEAVRKGLLVKLRMNYRTNTTPKKRYAVNIVCDANKVNDAMGGLANKAYNGGTIISVTGVPKVRYR